MPAIVPPRIRIQHAQFLEPLKHVLGVDQAPEIPIVTGLVSGQVPEGGLKMGPRHRVVQFDLLEEIQFERVGAFTYSVEEGTRAAEMGGRVPVELMSERLEELMEVQRDISFEKNAALVGASATALVDEILDQDGDYTAIARTQAQALDIDGVTRLTGSDRMRVGELIKVQIIDALDYDLVAEVQGA